MSTKMNAEELAWKWFEEDDSMAWDMTPQESYAAAIREVAQPIADERDELREALEAILEADSSDEAKGGELWWADAVYPKVNAARAILAKYPKP
jgi:hypothetical protein